MFVETWNLETWLEQASWPEFPKWVWSLWYLLVWYSKLKTYSGNVGQLAASKSISFCDIVIEMALHWWDDGFCYQSYTNIFFCDNKSHPLSYKILLTYGRGNRVFLCSGNSCIVLLLLLSSALKLFARAGNFTISQNSNGTLKTNLVKTDP